MRHRCKMAREATNTRCVDTDFTISVVDKVQNWILRVILALWRTIWTLGERVQPWWLQWHILQQVFSCHADLEPGLLASLPGAIQSCTCPWTTPLWSPSHCSCSYCHNHSYQEQDQIPNFPLILFPVWGMHCESSCRKPMPSSAPWLLLSLHLKGQYHYPWPYLLLQALTLAGLRCLSPCWHQYLCDQGLSQLLCRADFQPFQFPDLPLAWPCESET